jgi:hypothetical protein
MALFESQQNTKKRHIISMKSRGFLQTPQEIMEEYNGYSVPQYTAYGLLRLSIDSFILRINNGICN